MLKLIVLETAKMALAMTGCGQVADFQFLGQWMALADVHKHPPIPVRLTRQILPFLCDCSIPESRPRAVQEDC